ncbi:MAG: family 43 glycosylhydrolase [Candidatus Velthaea sp.]
MTQTAYLDLFEQIAHDFGTRSTTDRRGVSSYGTTPLETLLDASISPDILYGYGDPGALCVRDAGGGRSYYVAVTSNDAPHAFPILRSRDLRGWEVTGFVFPDGAQPPWTAPIGQGGEYWAPELHAVDGGFVACFAAREPNGSFSIGLAHAATPSGPFVAAAQPLVRGGVIDPNLFVDDDGSAMLCWKRDDNDVWPGLLCDLLFREPQLIGELFGNADDAGIAALNAVLSPWTRTLSPMERFFVQQVLIAAVVANFTAIRATLEERSRTNDARFVADATAIVTAMRTPVFGQKVDPVRGILLGTPSVVLTNDLPWEAHLVEGPWITKQHGTYYLFYSGNDFSTADYGVGVAVAGSPLGPYAKRERPFIRSTPAWWGPGHPSVAEGPDGRPWMFLHAYRPERAGYKQFRALLGVPLTFANGIVGPG